MKALIGFSRITLIIGLPRIIMLDLKWFVENDVLVRQLCRVDQKLRPLLYNPPAQISWQTIRELFQHHHLLQPIKARGCFFTIQPTIERECEPKRKV